MVLDHVGRTVGVGDDLLDKHPAVVEESVRRGGRDLLHAPIEVVVAVGERPSPSNMAQYSCHLSKRLRWTFLNPAPLCTRP